MSRLRGLSVPALDGRDGFIALLLGDVFQFPHGRLPPRQFLREMPIRRWLRKIGE